jgi:vancomycin resistance protein YoaR
MNSASAGQSHSAAATHSEPEEAAQLEVPEGTGGAAQAVAQQYLDQPLVLKFAGATTEVIRSQLGARLDGAALKREAARLGGKAPESYVGDSHVPVKVNRKAVQSALVELKNRLDRGPVNAHFDLEARKVYEEVAGLGLDVFGSISAIEVALRSGAESVDLEGVELPAAITMQELGISDVSTVIGNFKTKFSVSDKTRNDNLKLLASKVDGLVLQPGQEFSFNETTGERTLEDGFKMAHVISQGQMVDGMAGGSCQISTTLHGAAFFSGLDIVSVTPHSRPSTYVTLGLDATVVASKVDLKLKNPYDFPVVIHYRVARGVSHVEILGKEKPFDTIEFERKIERRIDFETVTREDSNMGMGNMVVDQSGYPGYKLSKVRRTIKDGEVIKEEKWKLSYRPVVEYARLGINPDPNLPPPKKRKSHGPKPASGTQVIRQ